MLLQAGQDRATGMPDECSASVTSQASLPGGHGLPSTRQPAGQDQRGETASDPFTPPCPTPTARGQAAKLLLQASSSVKDTPCKAWGEQARVAGGAATRVGLRRGHRGTALAATAPSSQTGKPFIQVAQQPLCLHTLYQHVRRAGGHALLCSSSRAMSYSAVFKAMRAANPDSARSKSAPNRIRRAYANFLLPLDDALGGPRAPAWDLEVSAALHVELARTAFCKAWAAFIGDLSTQPATRGLLHLLPSFWKAVLANSDALLSQERGARRADWDARVAADRLVTPFLWEACGERPALPQASPAPFLKVVEGSVAVGTLPAPHAEVMLRIGEWFGSGPLARAPALLFVLHAMGTVQGQGAGAPWLNVATGAGKVHLKVRHPRERLAALLPAFPPAADTSSAAALRRGFASGALPPPGVHPTASNNSANTLSVVGTYGALDGGRAFTDAAPWRMRAVWAVTQLLLAPTSLSRPHLTLAAPAAFSFRIASQPHQAPPPSVTPGLSTAVGGTKRSREASGAQRKTCPPAKRRPALTQAKVPPNPASKCTSWPAQPPKSHFEQHRQVHVPHPRPPSGVQQLGVPVQILQPQPQPWGAHPQHQQASLYSSLRRQQAQPYAVMQYPSTTHMPRAAFMRTTQVPLSFGPPQAGPGTGAALATPGTLTAVTALHGLGGTYLPTPAAADLVVSARHHAMQRAVSALASQPATVQL